MTNLHDTWRLGDLTVNRLGLGAMRLTGMPWDEKPKSREDAITVLRRAIELGVNHIDTASFYFTPTRSANELIATALQPYPEDLVITTKVGAGRSRDGEFSFARPDRLRGQVEENIRQLGLDHLDVVNLRWGAAMGKEPGSVAEHFGALAELREAGLIRHLGISNVVADQLTEARSIAPVVCVQNRYGLTDREDDALLDLCGELGIAFVPFFAVTTSIPGAAPGAVGGEAEVAKVAAAHDATPAQIRLAWTLHRGAHVLAIPGTGDPGHLAENVAAGGLRLSEAELALLDGVGRG
ncbi:oxidoreductase [Amycolatopsis keratiniphila]|uniref:oxidoreductase n=1 Tax=Amycolatopsis keratiniphila TaxID=129921 RepID=UPI00087D9531|nr:oxidoreductase [Amycolatopsis keratiniphila]OLZ50911.1 aldo/keto reductase [Amycolatopsis keratiniphila subsp. nogabecina]SDU44888.1 Predicted oxidoreductase [Amycolatopsis keratiniphila]